MRMRGGEWLDLDLAEELLGLLRTTPGAAKGNERLMQVLASFTARAHGEERPRWTGQQLNDFAEQAFPGAPVQMMARPKKGYCMESVTGWEMESLQWLPFRNAILCLRIS
jgi:hypothetical protein